MLGRSSIFSNNEVNVNDESKCQEEREKIDDSLKELDHMSTFHFKNPFSSIIIQGRDDSGMSEHSNQ